MATIDPIKHKNTFKKIDTTNAQKMTKSLNKEILFGRGVVN